MGTQLDSKIINQYQIAVSDLGHGQVPQGDSILRNPRLDLAKVLEIVLLRVRCNAGEVFKIVFELFGKLQGNFQSWLTGFFGDVF
jgi:hypothetical protein